MAVVGLLLEVLGRCRADDGVSEGLRYLAALQKAALDTQPGEEAVRVDVRGDKVFALHQSYMTRPTEEWRYEAHRNHIDLQYIVSGTEVIRVAPLQRVWSQS